MIFDKACGVAERHFPELADALNNAHLFVFDKPSHEIVLDEAGYEEGVATFHLPFPKVAIEDGASLFLLEDSAPDQFGPNAERRWWEVVSFNVNFDHFNQSSQSKVRFELDALSGRFGQNAVLIHAGLLFNAWFQDRRVSVAASHAHTWIVDKKRGLLEHISAEQYEQMHGTPNFVGETAPNLPTVIEQVAYINSPTQFVVQETPKKSEKQKKAKKILRTHQRPTYTVISKKKIKAYFAQKGPSLEAGEARRSPVPHIRRKHVRRLVAGPGKPWKKVDILPHYAGA